MMALNTEQITPDHLINGYTRFYQTVHGRSPRVRHMGGQWFQVNGEIVHYKALMDEIGNLRVLARKKTQPEKGLIKRLIGRLQLL
jgi:hypothetical protein